MRSAPKLIFTDAITLKHFLVINCYPADFPIEGGTRFVGVSFFKLSALTSLQVNNLQQYQVCPVKHRSKVVDIFTI